MFFLELSCFFDDPADVGNLISGSSAFSKTSLNIKEFTVHVLLKSGLENFEHHFTGSWKKQESSRKTSISVLLTIPKPLINNKLWKILKEMGIPDHLTCLLRNLYAGQEATVRTGHGTTDWFQIGTGVRQGCILSPCLFKFYAEYIMRNARLKKPQAGNQDCREKYQ